MTRTKEGRRGACGIPLDEEQKEESSSGERGGRTSNCFVSKANERGTGPSRRRPRKHQKSVKMRRHANFIQVGNL